MLEGLFRAPAMAAVRVLFDGAGAAEFPAALGIVGAAVAAAGVVAAAAFAAAVAEPVAAVSAAALGAVAAVGFGPATVQP